MYTARVNVCMKVHRPLNTQKPEEGDGNPILPLSDIFLQLGSLLNFLSLFPWFGGTDAFGSTGAHAAASGSLYGFWGSQLHVYKTSALTPDPSFQSLSLNLISHDAYETNIMKLHMDPYRNYDAPQPRAVEGKI